MSSSIVFLYELNGETLGACNGFSLFRTETLNCRHLANI